MRKEPRFHWNEDDGIATCYLTDGKHTFIGTATCAEIDKDMMSRKTGCQIALYRAEIHYYIHLRDNEILPALNALKHTYACMVKSKFFNEQSYESKSIRKDIHRKEFDLSVVRTMLNDKKRLLKQYVNEKEEFYKKIRGYRSDGILH